MRKRTDQRTPLREAVPFAQLDLNRSRDSYIRTPVDFTARI